MIATAYLHMAEIGAFFAFWIPVVEGPCPYQSCVISMSAIGENFRCCYATSSVDMFT